MFRTRFAPSPTGPLHLGHAYSALLAHDTARAAGGAFALRIEDLDQSRARPEWEDLIAQDLRWLGITCDGPVRRQSEHADQYRAALARLEALGLIYHCACTRRDTEAAAGAPQEGVPAFGPDGQIYPGTCRTRGLGPSDDHVVRLNMAAACVLVGDVSFVETGPTHAGTHSIVARDMVNTVGDAILIRRQMAAAYHLAVVVDDAETEVSHVIRGQDLFEATQIHVLLQNLLRLPTPVYHHHRLIRDEAGKRLAKRDDARAIRTYRDAGATPDDIRRMVGLD